MSKPHGPFWNPTVGRPEIRHEPGMADELMRELAPLLAEDGIDLNDPETIPELSTLQRALDRAIERRNAALADPVGEAREVTVTTLRLYVEAFADEQYDLAAALLQTAVAESPDNSRATHAAMIGVALDLLDSVLTGSHPLVPDGISQATRLPRGRWEGERAARDILDLARQGRASQTSTSLVARQGGRAVEAGAALALAAVARAWADLTHEPVDRVTVTLFG